MYGEAVYFGTYDNIIRISGKVDKSNTYNGFSSISFFIQGSFEVFDLSTFHLFL